VVHDDLLAAVLFSSQAAFAESKGVPEKTLKRIRAIVVELGTRLQMRQRVEVSIVSADPRMVSVQHIRGEGINEVFIISLDRTFFESLDREELRAAIAHELGHIWISSHHPYLHTETFANEIAMRAVSRESMKKVYTKLWAHLGTTGDYEQLLGRDAKPAPPQVSTTFER
jgi:hypothetical protein